MLKKLSFFSSFLAFSPHTPTKLPSRQASHSDKCRFISIIGKCRHIQTTDFDNGRQKNAPCAADNKKRPRRQMRRGQKNRQSSHFKGALSKRNAVGKAPLWIISRLSRTIPPFIRKTASPSDRQYYFPCNQNVLFTIVATCSATETGIAVLRSIP